MTMIKRKPKPRIFAQRGYAMLGIIAAVGVAATAVVVTSLSATALRNEQGRNTSSALALAKQALLASAASHPTHPGSLPCPDIDNDGQSDPPAGACTATIGRLPWQTLGLPDLRDTASERLWYVVSTNFQDVAANRINAGVYGQLLTHSGENHTTGVVAIVFAPGQPVGNQQRDAAHANDAEHYLESYAIATKIATLHARDSTHNDQFTAITPADIFSLVERRVAKEFLKALENYSTATLGRLPWPAQTYTLNDGVYSFPAMPALETLPYPPQTLVGYVPTNDVTLVLPAWFTANNWGAVMQYRVDSDCAGGGPGCGTAFAGYAVATGNVSIGFTGDVANPNTKALLSFSGVNTMYSNYQTTVLNAAMQLP